MAANEVFEQLSRTLSDTRRRELLAEIRGTLPENESPVEVESPDPPPPVESIVSAMSFFQRVRLLLVQIFTGKERHDVVRRWVTRDLEKELSSAVEGAVDVRRRLLREPVAAALEELASASAEAEPLLSTSSTRQRELVVALAIGVVPGVHYDLMRRTDSAFLETHGSVTDRTLKKELNDTLERTLRDIGNEPRYTMRRMVDAHDRLQRITSLPLASVLSRFDSSGATNERTCAFSDVESTLETLLFEMQGLTAGVDPRLFESIVLVSQQQLLLEEDTDRFSHDLKEATEKLARLVGAIGRVSSCMPIVPLFRVFRDDPWWTPTAVAGGEEWLAHYRSYFAERVQAQVVRRSLTETVVTELQAVVSLAGSAISALAGIPGSASDTPSTRFFTAALLRLIGEQVRALVWPPLSTVSNNGEFYKPGNRAQFNDAFAELERIPADIAAVESRLTADGVWSDIRDSTQPLSKRRATVDSLDRELDAIASRAETSIDLLTKLLDGILFAPAGGAYDTLANFGQIGGRSNASVIDSLKTAHARLKRALAALVEVQRAEQRASENEITLDSGAAMTRANGG